MKFILFIVLLTVVSCQQINTTPPKEGRVCVVQTPKPLCQIGFELEGYTSGNKQVCCMELPRVGN